MSQAQPLDGSGLADSAGGGVDLHCHILPGLDDGPANLDEAIGLCRAMARDGIAQVVATPHMLGRYELVNSAPRVRQAVVALQGELLRRHIPLSVYAGGEIRLDERIGPLLATDQLLSLADRRTHVLLELPTGIGFEAEAVISRVSTATGMKVVLAHAERYEFMRAGGEAVHRRWVDSGAMLQVNAGSLAGAFGPAERDTAWLMVESGAAEIVATDAHSLGQRRPRWSEAMQLISQRVGAARARQLCVENPGRILSGNAVS